METPQFKGVIGDDWRTSTPWWPELTKPPEGAPNVILIVLDDVGFAQLGCYGSDIATPTIDGLAAHGVRMTNFHTTALCSPTRACLMTGRNHHRNGLGRVADLAVGFPGYNGEVPKENGFLSEILRQQGYATYAIGKWHLTPEDETHMAAPRHSWPLARGFDRWYGFHGGETHQFVPALYHDNHSIQPPASIEDGYHLSADLVDQAIRQLADLRSVDQDRRFFLYFCTGACHSPHHAPAAWIDRYRGHFDKGWDQWRAEVFERQLSAGLFSPGTEMAPRPPWVPAWDALPDEEKRVAARFMECFAGFLSYTDTQLKRLLDFLEQTGDRDDTLIILVSDNGASSEGGPNGSINDNRLQNFDAAGPRELARRIDELGGPTAHNNYPWGWTMAGNTPFKRWKREVHEGGVADPCIVSWPARLPSGEIRKQFAHAVDILPTVLELGGVEAPVSIEYVPQSRIDGISFAPLLRPGAADAPGHRMTQYFEMFGSRALYHDGWKAVTFKPIGPLYNDGLNWNAPFSEDRWELYHVAVDPAEIRDLADKEPDRVADMIERWWTEARNNQVLPLDNRVLHTINNPKPDRRTPRLSFRYYPGTSPVPEPVAANVKNRSHTIEVDVTVTPGRPSEGVLLAEGSVLGGFSFHLYEGRPRYVHNLYGKERHVVAAERLVEEGRHLIVYRFERDEQKGGGTGRIEVDGTPVAEGVISTFTIAAFSATGGGLTCGYESGPAVGDDYEAPFPCTATIHSATVTLGEHVPVSPMVEFERIMAEQ